MQERNQILFHIGLPKAASSTLQKHLFPYISDLNNFALYPTNNVSGSNRIPKNVNSVYLKDTQLVEFYKSLHNKFEVGSERLAEMWGSLFNTHALYSKTLLSHEAMTSAFFSSIPVNDKLLRIKSLFPDVKICIVIRKQESWLHSQYCDHPFLPTNLSNSKPCDFNEWVNVFLNDPKLASARAALDYYSLICQCQAVFGEHNLTIISFEWLKNNPTLFYDAWAKFLGVSYPFVEEHLSKKLENRGLSRVYNFFRQKERNEKIQGHTSKLTTFLLKMTILKLLPKAKYTLSPTIADELRAYYAESNKKVNVLMGWR
jgi:hypothetical protein